MNKNFMVFILPALFFLIGCGNSVSSVDLETENKPEQMLKPVNENHPFKIYLELKDVNVTQENREKLLSGLFNPTGSTSVEFLHKFPKKLEGKWLQHVKGDYFSVNRTVNKCTSLKIGIPRLFVAEEFEHKKRQDGMDFYTFNEPLGDGINKIEYVAYDIGADEMDSFVILELMPGQKIPMISWVVVK